MPRSLHPLTILAAAAMVGAMSACKDRSPAPTGGSAAPSAASAPSQPARETASDGTRFSAAGVSWIVPENWLMRPPMSTMRTAEFEIAPPEGTAGDAVIVAVFTNIRGSVEENIQRWMGQITGPEEPIVEIAEVGGLTVTRILAKGEFSAGVGMGAGAPIPDAMMLGAVISGGPQGNVFFKAVGERQVLEPVEAEWNAMLESVSAAG